MADTHQMHETLVIVISQALGGKSSSSGSDPPPSEAAFPQTVDELEARMARILG